MLELCLSTDEEDLFVLVGEHEEGGAVAGLVGDVVLAERLEVGNLLRRRRLDGAEAGLLEIVLLFLKVGDTGGQNQREEQEGNEGKGAFHAGIMVIQTLCRVDQEADTLAPRKLQEIARIAAVRLSQGVDVGAADISGGF